MQNLLNEEEFIQPKAYKPWKWFLLWYGLVLLQIILYLIINQALADTYFDDIVYTVISYTLTGIKLSLPFLMIFSKKENIMLPYKTLLLALIGMFSIYMMILLVFSFFANSTFGKNGFIKFVLQGMLYDFLVYKTPTIIIIFLIVMYKRKKALKRAI